MHNQGSPKNIAAGESSFFMDEPQHQTHYSNETTSKFFSNKNHDDFFSSSHQNKQEELERLYQSELLIEKAQKGSDQIPIMMSFEVEAALEASEGLTGYIQEKIREREKRLKEFEGICYKVLALVFSMLGGVFATTILFNFLLRQRFDNFSRVFIDLIFNVAQCCIFYVAYRSVTFKNVESAKKVVHYLKFFTVFYAIVYMTIACANKREILEKTEGLASYFQERAPFAFDLQIISVVINTAIYLVFFDRAIKMQKLLSELYIYQYKLFGFA